MLAENSEKLVRGKIHKTRKAAKAAKASLHWDFFLLLLCNEVIGR